MSEDPGELSDGYHTFNDLYRHRRALFFALGRALKDTHSVWRSKLHHEEDMEMYEGMFIAGIGTEPGQQIRYHFKLEYWDSADFAQTLDRAPKWDGHTPEDSITRLNALAV
jgi:hypothetical protein